MAAADGPAVIDIYQDGIATGHATFEASAPTFVEWQRGRIDGSCLIGQIDDKIAGFAALSPVSDRCAYQGVAEVSVYVAAWARGKKLGHRLLLDLIAKSEALGIWTLQAGIFPENQASIKAHEASGFRRLGVRERIGKMSYGPMAGTWRNVIQFERRSSVTGIN